MIARESSAEARTFQHEGATLHEEALVAALKARSPEAWAHLYELHYRYIYRFALLRTSDPVVAEDVAATVFLEALRSIGSYSYRGRPILAWLYRIARNVVSDQQKAQRRAQGDPPGVPHRVFSFFRYTRPQPSELPVSGAGDDPATAVDRLDLEQAIRRLTASQQEVVALHYYLGLTAPEVARVLGKREAAVYSLLARAIAALRHLLAPRQETS